MPQIKKSRFSMRDRAIIISAYHEAFPNSFIYNAMFTVDAETDKQLEAMMKELGWNYVVGELASIKL